jgi:glucose dehydrogenase
MFRLDSLLLLRIFGALLVLFGLVMAGGGLYLVLVNGSPYYMTFGALLIASGVLVFLKRRSGAWVFSVALLLTVAWSVREVGFHVWLLLPRLDVPLALGAAFLLPWIRS